MKKLKWWHIVLIVIALIVIIYAVGGKSNSNTASSAAASTATSVSVKTEKNVKAEKSTPKKTSSKPNESKNKNDLTPEQSSTDAFIKDVKKSIKGAVGKGESIKGVTLKDNDLRVRVDFSKVNPAPLTMKDLAISRTSSITDSILDLSKYDDLWDTITIDFGSLGKITNKKDNIKENDYGGRYFPTENFALK